jgi:phosphate transport system substrate-binding protein
MTDDEPVGHLVRPPREVPDRRRRLEPIMRSTTTRLGAVALASGVLVTALAGSALAQDAEGNVIVSGSSTVEPISLAVSEEFNILNPNWTYSVEGPGTTAGFEQFCNGEIDVADASRTIREEELATCTGAGVTPVELQVAIDGLAVITNPANEALTCLNFTDLYAIFGPEADTFQASAPEGGEAPPPGVRTWEQAAELAAAAGSTTTSWPTGDLSITAPGDESGTHDSFIEIALADVIEARTESIEPVVVDGEEVFDRLRTPGDIYVASPNDNVIIDGVSGFPTGIGFVGYAFAANNPDRVKLVAIDGGDGNCVLPDPTTVADGSYPIARPLFIYPDQARLDPASDAYNPGIVPFVDFYLSDEGQPLVTSPAGYVQIPPEALEAVRAAWEEAKAAAGGA